MKEHNKLDKKLHDLLTSRIYRILSRRPSRAIEVSEPLVVGSTTGSIRTRNEDIAAVVSVRHQDPSRDYQLALVCDGLGGMADGRHAAILAASNFITTVIRSFNHRTNPMRCLSAALSAAQAAVYGDLRGHGGATLSAALVPSSGDIFLLHVGDSRIYGITGDANVEQLSRDDTLGAILNRPNNKRPDNNQLIQFVGLDGELEPQLRTIARPAFEALLLTSDGAHSAPPELFATIIKHSKNGPELARKLLNVADALGGLDNATVVYMPTTSGNGGPANHAVREGSTTLLATLLSVSGEHDVWFEALPAVEPKVADRPDAGLGEKAARAKAKPAKKSKPAKRANPETSGELPLDVEKPVAKLDFSDKEDGK